MDPLQCFPLSIQRLIFQNLSGKEILKLSLVHPDWNYLIGKSPQLMNKIKLVFRSSGFKNEIKVQEIITLTETSVRRYSNVKISGHYRRHYHVPAKFWNLLLKEKYYWKHVELRFLYIVSPREFLQFIYKINKSVEWLHLKDVLGCSDLRSFPFSPPKFHKLKYFELTDMSQTQVLKLFCKSQSVETIKIFTTIDALRAFPRYGIYTGGIQHLHLNSRMCNATSVRGFLQLKLLSFSLDCSELELTNLTFLTTFLPSQNSLESISLLKFLDVNTMQLLLTMPNLRKIKIIKPPRDIAWADVEFPENQSITTLEFVSKYQPSLVFMKKFLSAAKKLMNLGVHARDGRAIESYVISLDRNIRIIFAEQPTMLSSFWSDFMVGFKCCVNTRIHL